MRKLVLFFLILAMISGCAPSNNGEENISAGFYGDIKIPDKRFKVGIVLTVWERPEVLKTTIQSLENAEMLEDTIVVVVDDHSKSQATINIVNAFTLPHATVVKIRLSKGQGLLKSMLTGFNLIRDKVDYLMNIDPDVYVKKGWVTTMSDAFVHIKEEIQSEEFILTGFNTQSHETIGCAGYRSYKDIQAKCCTPIDFQLFFCPKRDLGGINFFYSANFYNNKVHHVLQKLSHGNWKVWDWDLVKYFQNNNYPMYALSPSVIQHLGTRGTNATPDVPVDFAEDF